MTRRENDHYPTPPAAVDELLKELNPAWGYVCDPAAGDGALLDAALAEYTPERGYLAIEVDRAHKPPHYVLYADYLTLPPSVDPPALFICNPPYALAQEFVTKMLAERGPDTIVAALLRLGFLGSRKRHEWWKENHPHAIRILSKRPSFTGDGKTDNSEYMWAIWFGRPSADNPRPRPLWWYAGGA